MIVLFLVLFCVENIARKGAVKMDKSAMNKTEQAFETYRPIILSRVKLFTAHRTRANAAVGWDDLMQEASLWFITTMQTQGLEAARRHRLSLHHALYEAVRLAYPLHIPYHAFAKQEKREFIPLESIESNVPAVEDGQHMTSNLYARMLYAMLTPDEKDIVDRKLQGMTLHEIAQELGMQTHAVYYIVRKMRTRLAAYSPMKQEG